MTSIPVSFQIVIQNLSNYDHPFPGKYLPYFSDLTDEQQSLFIIVWKDIKVDRKLSFLTDLEELSEHDTLTDFSTIGILTLHDADEQVREAALHLLWDTENKSPIPTLLDLLANDHSGRVRATAASILGHYIYLGETDKIPQNTKSMIEECLLNAYNSDSDKLVRRRVLESLGFSSRKEVRKLINSAISSGDNEWLASALFAMGRSADSDWSKQVMKYLDHSDDLIREEAIRAAGELRVEPARKKLLELLENEKDDEMLLSIIWSLSQIGGEDVRESIETQLDLTKDDEMIVFIEDALDNLNFTEELSQFNLLDINDPKYEH